LHSVPATTNFGSFKPLPHMKKPVPFVLFSIWAFALPGCKRTPDAGSAGRMGQEEGAAKLTSEAPAPNTGDGEIHSTDVPTMSELAAADPRTAKVMAKVRGIVVKQLGVAEDKVVPAADLFKDLGADSLDAMELVMAFEEEFNLSIKDEEAEKIRTVEDAVQTLISLGAR
jgi:acyl carrier protein